MAFQDYVSEMRANKQLTPTEPVNADLKFIILWRAAVYQVTVTLRQPFGESISGYGTPSF
jgi:hypothetical protein